MALAGCGGNENVPSASILNSGEVTLTWKDVKDSVAYNIYVSRSPNVTDLNSYKISHVTKPFTITHLEPGATYYFVVAVEDGSGKIRKSKEISYTVAATKGSIQFGDALSPSTRNAAAPDSKPAAKAPAAETRDVTLAWENVPNATSYNIYYSDKPGVTKKNGIKISNVKNPHKITGLKKGERYYFVVTTVNASGESKESKEISYLVQ
jgi:fibronectin type 3 domain-containing protein